MKFIAVQSGARRGYAVPRILHDAGMLERFYTDLAGNVGAGRWLAALRGLPAIGSKFSRLASRQIPAEIVPKTRVFGGVALGGMCRSAFGSRSPEVRYRHHLDYGLRWGRAMIRCGFGEATHIFSMLNEGSALMAEAHRRGLTVVAEVYILLSSNNIVAEERRAFPGWEQRVPNYAELRSQYLKENVLLQRTHFYICPSEAVRDDLVENWGALGERTALVPYGMDSKWLELESRPQLGRVLFVGTADLRKGIHYLAMAAEKLNARGRHYEFRIAGNVTEQVRQQPVCRHLTFLGRVPRDRIHEEFQKADVFVLPSLAEGSAEVTYEALAAAVPLIVTKAAGSVARDEVEGQLVPERDPNALADAIERIIEDRPLRERLAVAARERAREFTWEKYGERLIAALRGFSR